MSIAERLATGAIDQRAVQMQAELRDLVELLLPRRRRIAIEVGCGYGGTLWLWGQLYERVIAVDDGRWGLQDDFGAEVITGDSAQESTIQNLADRLAGRRADLLFIDADHSYRGVSLDFVNYRFFVRPGGWVVFHDIASADPLVEVPKFWAEIRTHECVELITPNPAQQFGGIGIYPV